MIPREKSKVIIDEPPTEIKGKGIPVTGKRPIFIPILIKVCIQIWIPIPRVKRNKGLFLVEKALLKRVLINK